MIIFMIMMILCLCHNSSISSTGSSHNLFKLNSYNTSIFLIYLSTTLHYTTLHYTTLHYIALHYTTLHYTTLHYTTLHTTNLHYTVCCVTIAASMDSFYISPDQSIVEQPGRLLKVWNKSIENIVRQWVSKVHV